MNAFEDIITYTPPKIILSSCSESKLSHIIIYPTVLFSNMAHLKIFVNSALAYLKDILDHNIYTRYQISRTFMSTKFRQNRSLIHLQIQ